MLGVIRARQQRSPKPRRSFSVLQLNLEVDCGGENLAAALLAQDKPDAAIEQYNHAIALSPQDRS
jgi:hypothetical protein